MFSIKPDEISKKYYNFINNIVKTDFESEKVLGKYYTDLHMARHMVNIICSNLNINSIPECISIIDPFCGDGRLILMLLDKLRNNNLLSNKSVLISAWDIDEVALQKAKNTIIAFCNENKISAKMDFRITDAFVSYSQVSNKYDICITNPPWSLLKPQKIFKGELDELTKTQYYEVLRQYDCYLKEEFQISQPSSKFGQWGTNLARCGTEVALCMIKNTGICGVVSPASLFNDQVSKNLRKWIFQTHNVLNISYYPAELKLFGIADISSVTIVVKKDGTQNHLTLEICHDNFNYSKEEVTNDIFNYIRWHGYTIPLKNGIKSIGILQCFDKLPSTLDYCKIIGATFVRELDETRIKDKISLTGNIRFAKGYMVDRYTFNGDNVYINEEKVTIPSTAMLYKVVWRDVSRDSQIRRIKATMLHPGFVCGNSLGTIVGNEDSIPYLKVLLAIMNSMVFEYQARNMLVSNHVSAGVIKKIHVPMPNLNTQIIELVDKKLKGENVDNELEVEVAKMYGISINEFEDIIEIFKITDQEKRALVSAFLNKNN